MTVKVKHEAALKALRDLVIGIEAAAQEEVWPCLPEDIWDVYVAARAVLGSPVVDYPGGYENTHIHRLKDEGEQCDTCADWAEEQALLVPAEART